MLENGWRGYISTSNLEINTYSILCVIFLKQRSDTLRIEFEFIYSKPVSVELNS